MSDHLASSLWARALGGDEAARLELAGRFWYPLYAYFRAAGFDAETAADRTEAVLTRLVDEAPGKAPLLREYLLGLARQEAGAGAAVTRAKLSLDRGWAAERFAGEGAHAPDEMYARCWTMGIIESVLETLQAEWNAAGKGKAFAILQGSLGFTGGPEGDEKYVELAEALGVSDGAARKSVFDLRTRHRELLHAAVAATVSNELAIARELQTLLVELPAPAAGVEPRSLLRRVNPEELLARGMNSVKMSTVGGLGWTPPTVAEAARLFTGYEVIGMLGHGGMGAVYQARQQSLDRLVAIKLLPLEISVDPSFADRFRREARAMARLNHPNIIAVYDFGQTGEGHLFFVMEFVDGSMLHDLIHREGSLPAPDALAIIEQVCEALAFAHEQGIVHRDIKPANVMVDTRGRAKVADFGLARLTDPVQAGQWGATMTGIVMGTPDYMAPEQKRGQHVDHRADIYSVGVMLYEALCEETPQGAFELPSRRCGLPREVDSIITRAIAPQPEKRFQSTLELKAAMASARPSVVKATLRRQSARAPTSPLASIAPGPRRSRPMALWASLAAAVLVLAAASYWMTHRPRQLGPDDSPVPSGQPPDPDRAGARDTESFAGHRYQFVAQKGLWAEAKAAAEKMGGHLATLSSPAENAWILKTFATAEDIWIGGFAQRGSPVMRWVNNEPFGVVTWETGHPAWRSKKLNGDTNPLAGTLFEAGLAIHARKVNVREAAASGSGFLVEWEDGNEGAVPPGRPASTPVATAPPASARLEPGAVRLFDSPEKLPQSKGIRWDENSLHLDRGVVFGHVSNRDALVRALVRMNSDTKNVQLCLRNAGNRRYMLEIQAAERRVELLYPGERQPLASWPLPRTYGPDEWLPVEFKAVGTTFTVKLDGKAMPPVQDDKWQGEGDLMVYTSINGYFRDIVYLPLDRPAASADKPPADDLASAARSFGGHRYQLLLDPLTWDQAKARAGQAGAHLATIGSREEHDFLATLFPTETDAWLGAEKAAAGWRWITGEPWAFTRWGGISPHGGDDTPDKWLVYRFRRAYPDWDNSRQIPRPALLEWDTDAGQQIASASHSPPPGPAPADSPPFFAVAADAAPGQPGAWQSLTPATLPDRLVREGQWLRGQNVYLVGPSVGDASVRARFRFQDLRGILFMRRQPPADGKNAGTYNVAPTNDRLFLYRYDESRATTLANVALPRPLAQGDEYDLEASVVGGEITVSYNGAALIRTHDDTFTRGHFGVKFEQDPIANPEWKTLAPNPSPPAAKTPR